MPHVELPQAEFKVVMLGETNAGKTSLVLRFAEGYYRGDAQSATVGAFFITKRLQVSGITCKVQIWDTAGQEQFKCMAPMYYRNAAAAIVCYDVTSPESYKTMKFWLDELHRNIPAGNICICIAATKTDLEPKVDLAQAEEMANSMGAMFVETSAKTNTNVIGLFRKVAERVLQFRQATPIPVTPGACIDERGRVLKKNFPTSSSSALSSDQNHHHSRYGRMTVPSPAQQETAPSPQPPPPPPPSSTTSRPLPPRSVQKPTRRDKRTKNAQLETEAYPTVVEENPSSKSSGSATNGVAAMCIHMDPFMCGDHDNVAKSCIIL